MRDVIVIILMSYGFGVVSNSNNVQLQAKIIMNKEFLKQYRDSSEPSSLHFVVELPPGLASLLGNKIANSALRTSLADKQDEFWSRDLKTVPRLVDYLMQNSAERLRSTITSYCSKIIKDNDVDIICQDIDATIFSYKSKLQQYVDNLLKYANPKNQIHIDIILLDIVQTSNRYVYEETSKYIQKIIEKNQVITSAVNIQDLLKELFNHNLQKKKNDFQFVCKMTKLCRPFPGFSDYLADIFGEVTKLPDNKLHILIMKTIVIVQRKKSVIQNLLGNHLNNKLGAILQKVVYDDLSKMRKALHMKRRDVFERYTYKKTPHRIKAFRILLDMIDKAFDMDGANKFMKHFNNMTTALRSWIAGNSINVEVIEESFVNYTTNTLTAKWVNSAKKEAKTLVHMSIDGKPGKAHYKYLLENGSDFVNNN